MLQLRSAITLRHVGHCVNYYHQLTHSYQPRSLDESPSSPSSLACHPHRALQSFGHQPGCRLHGKQQQRQFHTKAQQLFAAQSLVPQSTTNTRPTRNKNKQSANAAKKASDAYERKENDALALLSSSQPLPPERPLLPAPLVLRQMAGLPLRSADEDAEKDLIINNETPAETAARLKREANVAKAAQIEALRMKRERLAMEQVRPMGQKHRMPVPQSESQPPPPPRQQQPSQARLQSSSSSLNKDAPSTKPSIPSTNSSASSSTYQPKISPFKKFDPFFDYEKAWEEANQGRDEEDEYDDEDEPATVTKKSSPKKAPTSTASPSTSAKSPDAGSKFKPAIYSQSNSPSASTPSTKHANRAVASPAPHDTSSTLNQSSSSKSGTSRPLTASSIPTNPSFDPAESAAFVGSRTRAGMNTDAFAASSSSSDSSRVCYAPLPSKALLATKILQHRQETIAATKETVEELEKTAMQLARERLAKGFTMDEEGQAKEEETKEDETTTAADESAADPSTTSPVSKRGPKSVDATIYANKHAVHSRFFKKEAGEDEASRQQQQQKPSKKGKKGKGAAAREPPKMGPDGKYPLQPPSAPFAQPKVIPWHPAVFIKSFLMKIHPDLFHHGSEKQAVQVGNTEEKEQMVSSELMVKTNQDTVAKFNAIVDYYKIVKALPESTLKIPATPILPPHPQSLSFYCRVVNLPPQPAGAPPLTAAQKAALPSHVKLFEGEWNLTPFDLSSLPRLLAQIEELFIRLNLTTQVDLDPSVHKRWEVLVRQRKLEKELWAKGESHTRNSSGGYLTKDPTGDSYYASPGRYKQQYLSFYSQTPDSHTAISEGGIGFNAQALYGSPETSAKLPPLLEQMMRSQLLQFDESLDMMQRLQCLQTLITFFTGYDLSHLYVHLWLGIKIHVSYVNYSYDSSDHQYRYSSDEWIIPYNFEKEKLIDLIRQYLHAYHSDNPQGLTLIDAI